LNLENKSVNQGIVEQKVSPPFTLSGHEEQVISFLFFIVRFAMIYTVIHDSLITTDDWIHGLHSIINCATSIALNLI
jgi:hypothetical protein